MNPSLLPIITFAGVASALVAVLLGIGDLMFGRNHHSQLKRELAQLPSATMAAKQVGPIGQFDRWFAQTLYMSGLGLRPLEGALLFMLAILAAGGCVFVLSEDGLLSAAAALAAAGLTMVVILFIAHRRRKQFQDQFPAALDLLARAVRAGESLEQALGLVGDATVDPVGPEFKRCARQLEMGLAVSACMRAFAYRIPLMDVRIFCAALSVHRETGGKLPTILERSATVIRSRMSYHRQLKTATGAGRFSAMLIAALAPILFAYLFFFQPQYGGRLVEEPLGRTMLIFAVVSQLIGMLWVFRMVKTDY